MGLQIHKPYMMVFGRVLMGIGGESQTLTQFAWVTTRLKEKNTTFALMFLAMTYRIGYIANSLITPRLSKYYGLELTVMFGTILNLIGLICVTISFILDE